MVTPSGRDMSGRGRGNFGRGRFNHPGRTSSKPPIKKTLADYKYVPGGSNKSANECMEVTKYILNYIRRTFTHSEDVQQALEERKPYDFQKEKPKREISTETDPVLKKIEEEDIESVFKAEIAQYVKRKDSYRSNMSKAYGLLWQQCTKAMQNKINSRSDYNTKIKNDAIELLNAIEEHALQYEDTRYSMSIVEDALRNLLMIRQKEDEDLVAYTDRFKTIRTIAVNQVGQELELTSIIKELRGKNTTATDEELRKEAWEQFTAYLFISRSDQDKYGTFAANLKTQFSLGNDQYPKTLEDAQAVLSLQKFDKNFKDKVAKKKGSMKDKYEASKKNRADDDTVISEITLAQTEGVCYCCGKKGHYSGNCRHRNKPRAEWHMNQAKEIQNLLKHASKAEGGDNETVVEIPQPPPTNISSSASTSSTYKNVYEWAKQNVLLATTAWVPGVAMSQRQAPDCREWILLDNQSTCHFFCNPRLVSNIRRSNKTLVLQTNAGTGTTNLIADIADFGETWYDPEGMTNVLSLALVEKKYKVTYDSDLSIFFVHIGGKILPFKKSPEGLYYYQPTTSTQTSLVQTVEDNMAFYTSRQIERAKRARDLLHTLGCPSIADLKKIIKMNSIKDCPVTLDDINLAENIYGPDVASLKGKSTRPRPTPVVSDIIEVPDELIAAQHEIDLCIDTFFVNSLAFLATISRRIKYRTCDFIKSRKVSDYRSVLAKVITKYLEAGFTIKCIYADNEYEPVLKHFKENPPYTNYNLTSANEHVPEAERNIRVIKERIRATFHSLPFRAIPALFIKELASESTHKLNFFPPANGISPYYSPRDILSRQRLDYKKHCSIPQFSYVQAYEETNPKNSQQARSLDCIYLRPASNIQGGHVVYHLATKSPIRRHKVTIIPITTSVIEAVERQAKADGMTGLVLQSKDGTKFYDSSWTAGVNYQQNDQDNDYDDVYQDPDYEYESQSDEELVAEDEYNQDEVEDEPQEQPDPIQEETEEGIHEYVNNNEDDDSDIVNIDDMQYREEPEPLEIDGQQPRRSAREVRITERLRDYREETGKNYTQTETQNIEYCDYTTARTIAQIILYQRECMVVSKHSHATTFSLKTAIKKFGKKAKCAATKEMKQLHDRNCWTPIDHQTLTPTERKRAMEAIFFITEKSNNELKGRTCADGSVQRTWMSREEVSSPTVSTEATMITGLIEAMERRDVATCDIPNAFVQTKLEELDKSGNRTIMKIRGPLVEILQEMDPMYAPYVVQEGKGPVLYVHLIRALYGMLVSAMLFYKQLRKDLEGYGFVINPYDPCVANKLVNGKQLTVSWHVDDLKVSHVDPHIVTEFLNWVKQTYGQIGEVKITRGKIHDYLGMRLDYTQEGKFIVDMVDYITRMVEEYFRDTKPRRVTTPWNDNLFKVTNSESLDQKTGEVFHTTTAQGLFATKRARPDIAPVIAFLTTRVMGSTFEDLTKLDRMMSYLHFTRHRKLTLEADQDLIARWYVDAAFAVHPNMRSHTGYVMTLGKGAVVSSSRKQALNTRSSTEAELVAADDAAGPMLWTQRFLAGQGYESETILFQDNKSTMLLEQNGRASAGKRSRHLDIRLFFVHDLYLKKLIKIEHCPTDNMIGDYMTKPIHGSKFMKFMIAIMNPTRDEMK
jgi:hypothetical protein